MKIRRHRLAIDFDSAENMMGWFEDARLHGVFGYDVTDVDGITNETPNKGVGVRLMDSIDDARTTTDYVVSGVKDPGHFVTMVEESTETKAVVVGPVELRLGLWSVVRHDSDELTNGTVELLCEDCGQWFDIDKCPCTYENKDKEQNS